MEGGFLSSCSLHQLRLIEATGLPRPEDLLAALQKGESQEICQHRLTPDEHGVWVTNGYGLDCGLWQTPTLERVRSFLVDMAVGKEYGLIPG